MGFYLAVAIQFLFCNEREEACVTITLTLRYCSVAKKTCFLAFSRPHEACEIGKFIEYFSIASGWFRDPFKCPGLYSLFPGTSQLLIWFILE